ncbi:putative RNA-binding protein 23 [Manis javanica]|nr:putative RNA-binding protein 23 [Manis javanica]
MQVAAGIQPQDMEHFFSAVGKVLDVHILSDRNSPHREKLTGFHGQQPTEGQWWTKNEGNPRWELENIGRIDNIILMKDSGTGHSKGYGFITTRISFCHAAVVLLMKRTREQGPSGHQALNRSMALNLLVDLGELAM